MTTTTQFEQLLAELAGGELKDLEREVFNDLKTNPEGLTRAQLVQARFGYVPTDLGGNKDDRKIRLAIAALRERLIPIVSSSGEAGYRLDRSDEAIRAMINELKSRRDKLTERIYRAETMALRLHTTEMPDNLPDELTQMSFAGALT